MSSPRTIVQRIVEAVRAAGSAGMRPVEIERLLGVTSGTVCSSLPHLLRRGDLVRVCRSRKDVRYYAAGRQPAGADTRTTTRDLPMLAGPGIKRVDPSAPASVPPGLRVTLCDALLRGKPDLFHEDQTAFS